MILCLFGILLALSLLSLLDYSEDSCDCDHACGDCLPLVCPASTLSLPSTGPLSLGVHSTEPRTLLWLPAGRHRWRAVSRWVWLPPYFPNCHVLWWAGPVNHANHSLPCEIRVPPKQCHHSCAWLSSSQCNQSGVAHDAPQPADIWRHWQKGNPTSGLSQTEPRVWAQSMKDSCWSQWMSDVWQVAECN